MINLTILIYKRTIAEIKVIIPFDRLKLSADLIPIQVRKLLQRDDIRLTDLTNLSETDILKGKLIEIESPEEKIVISVE